MIFVPASRKEGGCRHEVAKSVIRAVATPCHAPSLRPWPEMLTHFLLFTFMMLNLPSPISLMYHCVWGFEALFHSCKCARACLCDWVKLLVCVRYWPSPKVMHHEHQRSSHCTGYRRAHANIRRAQACSQGCMDGWDQISWGRRQRVCHPLAG